MAETWALTARHLRGTLRRRPTHLGLALLALALLAALLLPGGPRAAGLVLLATLLVLALGLAGLAVGAGGHALPEDRATGREAWLAALAPPGWKRRLGVVLSTWLLVVAGGVLGGLVLGIVLPLVQPQARLHIHHAVPVTPGTVLAAGRPPTVLDLPAADGARRLEIEVRPLFHLGRGLPPERVEVPWQVGGARGTLVASARGPLRFDVPEGARRLALGLTTDGVRLRVVAARRLGAERPAWLALGAAGLLLGLLVGSAVPLAVLVSRATTGQTAAAAAGSLLLLGVVEDGVLALAQRVDLEGLRAMAPAVLEGLAWIAPDARLLEVVGDVAALRAPVIGDLGLVLPALLHTAIVGLLACLAPPSALADGTNP